MLVFLCIFIKKRILLLLTFVLISLIGITQTRTTVWTDCDTTLSPINVYDTIAVPVTLNQITGIRQFCEPDSGQIDSWSILGNPSFLKIEPYTGEVKITDPTYFNNNTNSEIVVTVRITDDGNPTRYDDANLHIVFKNDPPVILPQTFSVKEDEVNGFTVSTIVATDPNINQTKTYSILSGNLNNVFLINSTTGVLKVNNQVQLANRSTKKYSLIVKVTDNGTGKLSTQSVVTVDVIRVNKKPTIKAQTFNF